MDPLLMIRQRLKPINRPFPCLLYAISLKAKVNCIASTGQINQSLIRPFPVFLILWLLEQLGHLDPPHRIECLWWQDGYIIFRHALNPLKDSGDKVRFVVPPLGLSPPKDSGEETRPIVSPPAPFKSCSIFP